MLKAISATLVLGLLSAAVVLPAGCTTAPKMEDRANYATSARLARTWFERNVAGLRGQIDRSAGYIIFPEVGQWGILIGGGRFGRGTLNRPDGEQIGWAAINTGSIGLQAGVQGFKMLIVLEDELTLRRFIDNSLTGGVSGVAVAGEAGGSGTQPFVNGVAVYQGANNGLMAGVNIGLDYVRYEPGRADG